MHPFILLANWLAQQDENKSLEVEVAPESRHAVVNELCADESPVMWAGKRNLMTEKGCDDPDMDYVPKPKSVPRKRSKAPSMQSRV